MSENYRLQSLNAAIERAPNAPVNYLLRGEYWLEQGKIDAAQEDLITARNLAQKQLEQQDWGYIYQSYIDRAEILLERLR